MSKITEWAQVWGVSQDALNALHELLMPPAIYRAGTGESEIQNAVRLEAARKGVTLFRNNVGVMKNARDVPVRFGLANDSKVVNSAFKSGDLIGIRPVLITEGHIGTMIGQFVSRECKRSGWTLMPSDKRGHAQMAWALWVTAQGGDGAIATGVGTI